MYYSKRPDPDSLINLNMPQVNRDGIGLGRESQLRLTLCKKEDLFCTHLVLSALLCWPLINRTGKSTKPGFDPHGAEAF